MIKSMTGFGRAEMSNSDRRITVEIKSVNHRYLDFNVKLPKKLSCFEAAIRGVLKEYIQRGKVDIFITYEDFTDSNVQLKYNCLLAGQYLEYFRQMEEEFSIENDVKVSMLSRCPDVLTMEEMTVDETELWTELEQVLRKAAVQFTEARDREGQALLSDLLGKLDGMRKGVEEIEKREPEILKEYRERLMERTRELLADVQLDEARIASEVVLFADKICTDEETVRLRSHIDNMKSVLLLGGSIGRKLDFIAQEMNREANTILSKANDLDTSNIAIELKTEIEKVREQIQNIE
ncbi:MAG: YicC family protein [Lachnospiraceae bacterium]|nr:YicC family protein [Lachnospiraceae bacterium]